MNDVQSNMLLIRYEKAIVNYESLKHFNSLKRLIDPLIEGGTQDNNKKAAKTYLCLLDEISYVYYSLELDTRRLLKIENPDMVDIFKVFDQQEHQEGTRVDAGLESIEINEEQ